jgi:hypothetical protein
MDSAKLGRALDEAVDDWTHPVSHGPIVPPLDVAGGRKDDQGKDPWHLLPWDAVRCIVKVLAFGAKKYAPRNWEKGMAWSRPHDALIRHISAWWEGEKADPETGFSHLWHAGCCIFFLIAFELRGVGVDDRPPAKGSERWR